MARIRLQPEKLPWEKSIGTDTVGIIDVVYAEAKKRFPLEPTVEGPEALERLFSKALDTAFFEWLKALGPAEVTKAAGELTLVNISAVNSKTWNQYAKGKVAQEAIEGAVEALSEALAADGCLTIYVNRDSGALLAVMVWDNGDFVVKANHPITKLLYQQRALNKFNRAKRVRASSIGDCQRQLWFDLARFKEDEPEGKPEWKVVGAIGTILHEVLEDLLTTSAIVSRQEFLVEIEGIFGGKVDAELTIDDVKYILDWKTVGHKDFLKKEKLWKIKKYVDQLSSYGNLLNIRRAIVVLVDRNTSELLEVPLNLSRKYGEVLLEKAHETRDMVNELVVPAPTISGGCRFCSFQRQCGQEEDFSHVSDSLAAGVPTFRI